MSSIKQIRDCKDMGLRFVGRIDQIDVVFESTLPSKAPEWTLWIETSYGEICDDAVNLKMQLSEMQLSEMDMITSHRGKIYSKLGKLPWERAMELQQKDPERFRFLTKTQNLVEKSHSISAVVTVLGRRSEARPLELKTYTFNGNEPVFNSGMKLAVEELLLLPQISADFSIIEHAWLGFRVTRQETVEKRSRLF